MIEKHNLKAASGSKTTVKRIGRGNASGKGTTAGKGTKGQRARSGGRNKLKLKGLRAMFLSFPKNRGFRSGYPQVTAVKLEKVAGIFGAKDIVNLAALKNKGLIPKNSTAAKIVGGGEIKSALNLKGIKVTASVREQIEKAGGTIK